MSGYSHVCDACGAKIDVHDRYVGRTLRCTSCGTAFLADPVLAGAVRRAREEARDRQLRAVRRRRVAVGASAATVVLVAVLLWWLGRPAAEIGLGHRELFYGQIAAVAGPGVRLAAIDQAAIDDLVAAAESADAALSERLGERPDVIEVGAGTRLQVVEVRKRDHAVVVRVLDGVWTGRKVLIPVAWVE